MLAPGQLAELADGYAMQVMDTIEDIRHDNLLLILAEEFGGSIQALADALERSHSQVSQLKTRAKHSSTGKPREIGSDMARWIEAKTGKPKGWLDVPHEPPLKHGKYSPRPNAREPLRAAEPPGTLDIMQMPEDTKYEPSRSGGVLEAVTPTEWDMLEAFKRLTPVGRRDAYNHTLKLMEDQTREAQTLLDRVKRTEPNETNPRDN